MDDEEDYIPINTQVPGQQPLPPFSNGQSSYGRSRSTTQRYEPEGFSDEEDDDDDDSQWQNSSVYDDENDGFDSCGPDDSSGGYGDDDDDDDDIPLGQGGTKNKKRGGSKKGGKPKKVRSFFVNPGSPMGSPPPSASTGAAAPAWPRAADAALSDARHAPPNPVGSVHSQVQSTSDRERQMARQTLGLPTKEWSNPTQMFYNTVLDKLHDENIHQLDDLGPLAVFGQPSFNDDNTIEWGSGCDEQRMRMLLCSMDKGEVYSRLQQSAWMRSMTMCVLCGFMTMDRSKTCSARTGTNASRPSCEGDQGDMSVLNEDDDDDDGGQTSEGLDPYIYSNLIKMVYEGVSHMNTLDVCVAASIYWLLKAVIPSHGMVPIITPRQVFDHFFGRPCVIDYRLFVADKARVLLRVCRVAETCLIQQNAATGSRRVDSSQHKVLIDSIRTFTLLLQTDPNNMMFNGEIPGINPQQSISSGAGPLSTIKAIAARAKGMKSGGSAKK